MLSAGVTLLFPGIAIGVIAVPFPEAEAIVIEEHETADPLHTFPGVKVRDNKTERATVIGRKGFAIVFESEEHVRTLKVFQWDVGGVTCFGENESEFGAGFQRDAFENFGEEDTLPAIVKAAPAGDTVEIAGDFRLREGTKVVPGKAQRCFHQAGDLEIPFGGIEMRDAASMQHWPFEGEGPEARASFSFSRLPPSSPNTGMVLDLSFLECHQCE